MKFNHTKVILVIALMLTAIGACNHTSGYGNNPTDQKTRDSGGGY